MTTSLPNVLHPKAAHLFTVEFYDRHRTAQIVTDLSMQVTSVGLPTILNAFKASSTDEQDVFELKAYHNRFTLMVEEDFTERANVALYTLLENGEFNVHVKQFNGHDNAVSKYVFSGVLIDNIITSDLDYVGSPHKSATLQFPSYLKTDLPDHVLDFQRFLTGAQINLNDDLPHRGKIMKNVTLGFTKLSHHINKKAPQ